MWIQGPNIPLKRHIMEGKSMASDQGNAGKFDWVESRQQVLETKIIDRDGK